MILKRRLILICLCFLIGAIPPASAQESVGTIVPNHFWLGRPLPASAKLVPELGYPFGWNKANTTFTHHGVDLVNRRGTPVLAAAEGTVYYAGLDTERVFGEKPNFYGQLVIIQHDFDAPEGGRVFTLYGHLHTVSVESGMRVGAGQQIGTVGAKGVALGSHLHFEVRLGNPDDYGAVRNPELWTAPLRGTGTLIARLINADGTPAVGIRVTVTTADSVRHTFTYADGSVRSDPAYNENVAMGDLPAGCYRLRVRNRYDQVFCVKAGEATFVEAVLK
ncbi:Murein hydrolase activator NlpD [Anaerolineae bacterium]|nr:Murein hydrolase activator NlpD [Anaerolineae bacterium]